MIPKLIHQIWLGPKPCPTEAIQTWRDHHPTWTHRLWTERDVRHSNTSHLADCPARPVDGPMGGYKAVGCLCQSAYSIKLRNLALFDAFHGVYHAQADILRYEILYQLGGIYIDADSICLRPLDDQFLLDGAWACAENENGLLASCFLGATPKHQLLDHVLDEFKKIDVAAIAQEDREELYGAAWVLTGPCCLSEVVKEFPQAASTLRVYPGHYFFPVFHDGTYTHDSDVAPYAHHWWGSTHRTYDDQAGVRAAFRAIDQLSRKS